MNVGHLKSIKILTNWNKEVSTYWLCNSSFIASSKVQFLYQNLVSHAMFLLLYSLEFRM